MKTSLFKYAHDIWETHNKSSISDNNEAQLVLCFSAKHILAESKTYPMLKAQFPNAEIALCSTSGEIYHKAVMDDTLVAAALQFDKTTLHTASVDISEYNNSYELGNALIDKLPKENLTYILILSDGSKINGSELVKGIQSATEANVLVTGGLAGDAANFQSTLVGLNNHASEGKVVAIGLYGKNIQVSYGSQAGWEIFGPEREITKSEGNILYEIDGKNALELYKKYLGPEAENLPGSALLFPLSVIVPGETEPLVRTILSINEAESSMTFAGDIPLGSKARLMKANFDKLTSAAYTSALSSVSKEQYTPDFALLISCVGRKLILGGRIDEEVEAVSQSMGEDTLMAGFYSYGEISPSKDAIKCQLHNQTMTITCFHELP